MVDYWKTRDEFLNTCTGIRKFWFTTATHDIDLNEIADTLSRNYAQKFIPLATLGLLDNNCAWQKVPIQYLNLGLHILFQIPIRHPHGLEGPQCRCSTGADRSVTMVFMKAVPMFTWSVILSWPVVVGR